jgi:hypothetical protein
VTPVAVVWLDAHGDADGWTEISDLDPEPRRVTSVGLLLPTGEGGKRGHLTLAQTIDAGNGLVDSVLHIPRGMVRRVSVLVEALTMPLEP